MWSTSEFVPSPQQINSLQLDPLNPAAFKLMHNSGHRIVAISSETSSIFKITTECAREASDYSSQNKNRCKGLMYFTLTPTGAQLYLGEFNHHEDCQTATGGWQPCKIEHLKMEQKKFENIWQNIISNAKICANKQFQKVQADRETCQQSTMQIGFGISDTQSELYSAQARVSDINNLEIQFQKYFNILNARPIGIIAALPQEMALIKKQMCDVSNETTACCPAYSGLLQQKPVVLMESGIGKVAASKCCAIMTEKYNPRVVINMGVAGGLNARCKVGDILVANTTVQHDLDISDIPAFSDLSPGQLPEQQAGEWHSDPELLARTEAAARFIIDAKSRVYTGRLVTGDQFVHREDQIQKIQQDFPDSIAVDMESAAIAQVCKDKGTPFVAVRTLSDVAGNHQTTDFEKNLSMAGYRSEITVLKLIDDFDNEDHSTG